MGKIQVTAELRDLICALTMTVNKPSDQVVYSRLMTELDAIDDKLSQNKYEYCWLSQFEEGVISRPDGDGWELYATHVVVGAGEYPPPCIVCIWRR
jgi:hypothetical protein